MIQTMDTLRSDLRLLIAKYGLPAVHSGLQAEMRETFDFLRGIYEPPKNNLVIPLAETIPDRIATPHHKPISLVLSVEPPDLDLSANEEVDMIESVQQQVNEPKDPSLKDVIIQAKSEMNRAPGEKFTKAKHREDVLKKHKELTEKGIKPESLLTKENLSKWLGEGMSYMRIAREETGVSENEIAAIAKTFGLQSDVKKYIIMKKGSK
jgi:hypothetical protein